MLVGAVKLAIPRVLKGVAPLLSAHRSESRRVDMCLLYVRLCLFVSQIGRSISRLITTPDNQITDCLTKTRYPCTGNTLRTHLETGLGEPKWPLSNSYTTRLSGLDAVLLQ